MLEDFERKNVLEAINPKTGLIASSKKQKDEIESKYDIQGQIMVVPKAEPVDEAAIMKDNKDAITTYSSQHPSNK